jgi:hypothetical protein
MQNFCTQHREEMMEDINRRSALALGLTAAAATPLLAFATPALAAGGGVPNYGPTDGKDIGNGRRLVEVGEVESQINAYKIVKIIDVVYQPGAGDPVPAPDDKGMDVDMVCHIMAGEFTIQKKGIPAYTVKEGFLYTCGKGKTDQATNISGVVGIHRIALLIPA